MGHVRGYPACGSGEPSRRKFITRLRSTGGMDIDKQEEGGESVPKQKESSTCSVHHLPVQGIESKIQGEVCWELKMKRARRD